MIALVGNCVLFMVKLACGIAGDSRSVLADAAHSAADVVLALVVLVCLKVSSSPPDEEHPYGHGKIEYLVCIFVGISLSAVTVLIVWEATMALLHGVEAAPTPIAFAGLVVSIAGNELMFRHGLCCGRRFNSPAMIANAWENRGDVYSTLGAVVGVVGAAAGFLFMDAVGAVFVAILIGKSAVETMRMGAREMLDHSLDERVESKIRDVACAVPGVRGVTSLRSRKMGSRAGVELTVELAPDVRLQKGCEICEQVKGAVLGQVSGVGLITVSPSARPGGS
jgi:cation diffusion facilitator family transporter